MMSDDTPPGGDNRPPAIRRLLAPIRGRLGLAMALAGIGQVLALVPLAAIARAAQAALAGDGAEAGGRGWFWPGLWPLPLVLA